MSEFKQVVLPVTGMTCANCVATIERSLKKEKLNITRWNPILFLWLDA
jgi:cation transport ATPase